MEATPEGAITQAPKRGIVDLVDEIKQDLKAQIVEEIGQELRAGRTAVPKGAAPPAQIAPPSADAGSRTSRRGRSATDRATAHPNSHRYAWASCRDIVAASK